MKRMEWANIINDRCPKCGGPLVKRDTGYECGYSDPNPQTCRFFIALEKHTKLLAKLIKKPI